MNRGLANPVGSSVPYPTSRYAIMYLSLIPTDFQVLKRLSKAPIKKRLSKAFSTLEFKIFIFHGKIVLLSIFRDFFFQA